MRVGVFADWKPLSKRDIEVLKEIDATDVVLGVCNDRKQFRLNVSEKRILEDCDEIRAMQAIPHLDSWVSRREGYLRPCLDTMCRLAAKVEGTAMLNAEGDYIRKPKTADALSPQAGANLVGEYSLDPAQPPVGVVSFDIIRNVIKPLIEVIDYWVGEAYSFWKPGPLRSHWSHSSHTFPMYQQQRAWDSWRAANGKCDFVVGLGDYWGARPKSGAYFPGITDEQSLRACLAWVRALMDLERAEHEKDDPRTVAIAVWSLKHITGKSKTHAARRRALRWAREL